MKNFKFVCKKRNTIETIAEWKEIKDELENYIKTAYFEGFYDSLIENGIYHYICREINKNKAWVRNNDITWYFEDEKNNI